MRRPDTDAPPRAVKLTTLQIDTMVAMYAAGATIDTCATTMGVSYQCARMKLREAGVVLRGRGGGESARHRAVARGGVTT